MLATLPLTTGTWAFDPSHSGVHFKVRHLGLTNVHGRFNGVDAWLSVGDDLAGTRFGATIDIATSSHSARRSTSRSTCSSPHRRPERVCPTDRWGTEHP